MQGLTNIKRYLFLAAFSALSLFAFAGIPTPTSFLPMGDSYAASRNGEYGATIENIKPYRQTMPLESAEFAGYGFGSTDIFICVILFGIYIVFVQRKSKSRCAGL